MGRRGQRQRGGGKKSDVNEEKVKNEKVVVEKKDADTFSMADLEALFKPMPPDKRAQLNGIVEKLLNLSSNFAGDDPNTPAKLFVEFEEIWTLVQKVRNIEQQANMNRRLRGPRKMHIKPFMEWLNKCGAVIDGVEIAEFDNQGLGLKVTKDIKAGSTVLSIPRKVFMSTETAKDSSLSALIEKDPMLQRMPNVSLALHLLVEKNSPASFWEPYINILPPSYTTVLYFTPDDFKELRGSPALEDALKQFKYVARQYAYFYRKFQSMILRDYFTFDEYRWAVSTVMTRQNQVPCASDLTETTNTLIPFWDMANHDEGEVSTDYDVDNHSTLCMAHKDFVVGTQFTIFYGVRANIDLLVHNGFVFDNNTSDCLTLRLGISKNDPLASEKHNLLEHLSIPKTGHFFIGQSPEKPVDNILMAFVRVVCMTKDEIGSWLDNNGDKVRDLLNDTTNDDKLDKRAYKYMETRCLLLLKSYPTSLEQDEELMQQKKEASQKQQFCFLLRSKEKKLLNCAIKHCQEKGASL